MSQSSHSTSASAFIVKGAFSLARLLAKHIGSTAFADRLPNPIASSLFASAVTPKTLAHGSAAAGTTSARFLAGFEDHLVPPRLGYFLVPTRRVRDTVTVQPPRISLQPEVIPHATPRRSDC